MKRIFALVFCAVGLAFNACEKHPASELDGIHGAGHAHPPAAKHEAATAAGGSLEAKPAEGAAARGDAPKFFPEKK